MDHWTVVASFATPACLTQMRLVNREFFAMVNRVIATCLEQDSTTRPDGPCRHTAPRTSTFYYQSRLYTEEVMWGDHCFTTLDVCRLCFTHGMAAFYLASGGAIPKIHPDGLTFRIAVAHLNGSPALQRAWFCNPAFHFLDTHLPKSHACTYYPWWDQDMAILQTLEEGLGPAPVHTDVS
jgi:hypothetical protein